jgi:Tol biopolymer transport system component
VIPRLIFRFSAALSTVYTLVTLLALLISRTLPGADVLSFAWYRDVLADIYLMDIGRMLRHNLTETGTLSGIFAFSADGSQLAFEGFDPVAGRQIYLMNVECSSLVMSCGNRLRQLTASDGESVYPTWSPDGRQIALMGDVTYDSPNHELWVIDPQRESSYLIPYESSLIFPPVWSPDGSRIALAAYDDVSYKIYSVSPDGSDVLPLVSVGWLDGSPVWSPDSRQLIYVIYTGTTRELHRINADGSDERVLASGVSVGTPPVWSPDGSEIAFVANQGSGDYLYVMDANGVNSRALVTGTFLYAKLAWEGKQIMFTMYDGGYEDIYIVESNGDPLTRLTTSGSVSYPTWWP